MNRRTVLARLATLFIAIGAIVAVGGRASAAEPLAPCCPSYTIDIDCSIPPDCFPITVSTNWDDGAGGIYTWSSTYGVCGLYNVVPGAPPFSPCTFYPTRFKDLTINGSSTAVPLNQPTQVVIGGCCYIVSITQTTPYCIYIKITRC